MSKKIICLLVVLIICLGLLSGCGDSEAKINIGSEYVNINEENNQLHSCQVRVIVYNDIYSRETYVKMKIGFGFINSYSGETAVFKIDAENFTIINEANVISVDMYEEFDDCSVKYGCAKETVLEKKIRYIPINNENFTFNLDSDIESDSGTIQISFTNLLEGNGQTRCLYYAADSSKIAFSAISVDDALKKL